MSDLIGTVKIMNTRVYSGCGHAAVKEFPDHCPRCRIAKLEEEVARLQGLVRNYKETIEGNELDIEGLLEKLRAVGELRRFNVNIPDGPTGGTIISVVSASELEAQLKCSTHYQFDMD